MPSQEKLMAVIRTQTEIAKLGLDLWGVMQYIVEATLSLIAADGAAIELTEGDEIVYGATAGIANAQLGLRLKTAASLSGLSVLTGETLHCDDSELDPRVDRVACRSVGLRSMIVIPLRHQGVTVGVLKAMSAQPEQFTADDGALLGLLSEVVASAMYFSVKYDRDNLFYTATHDGMTGLANRSLFMDRLRNAILLQNRDGRPFAVLMIDMDGLKQVNDTFGHRTGDALILELAKRIKDATRGSDTVARLGGDEFGVILTPIELPEGMDTAIERIDAEIRAPFRLEGRFHPLGASIGGAVSPQDGIAIDRLLEVADQRMYAVKHAHHRSLEEA